ncbi:T9SS type A sorting domain-containing protein, partial [Bacteroidales bacterium OttesenSCG-928-A14]|nr:T9SS type A sorting domain-containing protein [Bacteroidales bacterium OttesenSCG-928-A14]
QDDTHYWIKENFRTFDLPIDYYQFDTSYATLPTGVELHAYYANTEYSEGECQNDSIHFRIRGLKDGGFAYFTVPDAKIVTIDVKGKSNSEDRIAYLYRNDQLIDSITGLDRDHCGTFIDSVFTKEEVTYKITGGDVASTKPVVITYIEVEKMIQTYTVDATASANGTIAPSGIFTMVEGADTVFIIKPNNGYKVDNIVVNGLPVTLEQDSIYRLQNITEDQVIRVDFALATSRHTKSDGIMVYPNPAQEFLYVEDRNANTNLIYHKIEIYTPMGKKIFESENKGNPKMMIDLSKYANGAYLLHISVGDGVVVKKFVVEKR